MRWASAALWLGLACWLGSCRTLTRPTTLEGWFALAHDGAGLALRADELRRRKEACDGIAQQPVVWAEERAIGAAAAVRWAQHAGGLLVDVPRGASTDALRTVTRGELPDSDATRLTAYVNRVGKNLAAQSSRPALPWVFAVTKSAEVNAWAAPGGVVLVSRGLLAKLDNEAQLAAVLAHEVAHVTGRHALNAYRRGKAASCDKAFVVALGEQSGLSQAARSRAESVATTFDALLAQPGGAFIDLDAAPTAATVVQLADDFADGLSKSGLSRADELAADAVAVELLANAGYDAAALNDVVRKLVHEDRLFATHPPPAERTKAVDKLVDDLNRREEGARLRVTPSLDPVVAATTRVQPR